jgi:hypothetical protein
MYTPYISPPDYFPFPKLKIMVNGLHFADVAEIQEAITDEINKLQKEEYSAALQKLHDLTKLVYLPIELTLNLKKLCLPHVSLNLKKISSKIFGQHCVYWETGCLLKL